MMIRLVSFNTRRYRHTRIDGFAAGNIPIPVVGRIPAFPQALEILQSWGDWKTVLVAADDDARRATGSCTTRRNRRRCHASTTLTRLQAGVYRSTCMAVEGGNHVDHFPAVSE